MVHQALAAMVEDMAEAHHPAAAATRLPSTAVAEAAMVVDMEVVELPAMEEQLRVGTMVPMEEEPTIR